MAKEFHPDLGADPGGEHVDAIDDRLRPDVRHPGHGHRRIQLADELSRVIPGRHAASV